MLERLLTIFDTLVHRAVQLLPLLKYKENIKEA